MLLLTATVLTLTLAACLGLNEADKRYNDGVGLLEEGRLEEAVGAFDQAVLLDGSFAAAYHNRALAKERLGRFPEAIEDYTRSIELDPGLAIAYANRGAAHNRSGDFGLALNDLELSLALDGESVTALTQRGLALDVDYVVGRSDHVLQLSGQTCEAECCKR